MTLDLKGLLARLLKRIFRVGDFVDRTADVQANLPADQQSLVTDVGIALTDGASIAGKYSGWVYLAEVADPENPPSGLPAAVSKNLNQ